MRNLIAMMLLGAAQVAVAQSTPYDGQWTAHFKSADGRDRQAKVVFKEGGGSWHTLNLPQGVDLCLRLEAPIEVLRTTPDEIEFFTRRSKVLAGCTDGSPATFRRIDDKTLEGVLSSGMTVRLVR